MIYVIEAGAGGPVKIGIATDPLKRLATLQTGCPYELRILALYDGGVNDEAELHRAFARDRIRGEWFERTSALDELIAELNGQGPPPTTYDMLRDREPMLRRLDEELREWAARAERMPTVCATFTWDRQYAPRVHRLLGWGRVTRAQADIAEAALRALLPPCRGCLCQAVT